MEGNGDKRTDVEPDLVTDLVGALLSVNGWGLEKTSAIYDGLRSEGLFDMDAVAEMAPGEVCDRLERAGYRRGDFMIGLLAGRLLNLAGILAKDGKRALR